MSNEPPFTTTGFKIERDADGRSLKLVFTSGGAGDREVTLQREDVPALLAGLQEELPPMHPPPIERDSLGREQTYKFESFGVRIQEDESAHLVLVVNFPDQGRTINLALPLSQRDVTELVLQLSGVLPKR